MASYAKIWTTIYSDKDFLSLSGNARGLFLQLIICAKRQRDNSHVFFRNLTAMGQEMGFERKTCGNLMEKLKGKFLLQFEKDENGVIDITLPNYEYWQGITVKELNSGVEKSKGKFPPLRPDKIKPDKIREENKPPPQKPNKKCLQNVTIEDQEYELVKLTNIEIGKYDKLIKSYPNINVPEQLREADLYWNGKKNFRKDHYLTFLNWIKNSIKYAKEKKDKPTKTSQPGSREDFEKHIEKFGPNSWGDDE